MSWDNAPLEGHIAHASASVTAIKDDPCEECLGYIDRRIRKVAPEMVRAAREQNRSIHEVAQTFMNGVHERHLAGLPI